MSVDRLSLVNLVFYAYHGLFAAEKNWARFESLLTSAATSACRGDDIDAISTTRMCMHSFAR